MSDVGWHLNSIPVLGTEPASENRIRSCCGSVPGTRFYCKPVTLVRCREIRGENRFSGRVGGKWLCEMTSAFIIKELRGALALRLFCGRSSFPPPHTRARTISGPFFLPEIPAPRGVLADGLADAASPFGGQIGVFGPFFGPEPSLFSLVLRVGRGAIARNINDLRAPVLRQLCPAVRHRTAPRCPAAPSSPPAADCAGTTAGSCSVAAARRPRPARWPVPAG